MDRKDRIDAFGGAILLIFSMAMGLNQVLIKIVNGGMSPVFQAGLRSACAVVLVVIYARYRGKRLSVSDGSLGPGVLCGLFFASEFLLLFQSLEFTTVARASIFFYTMPVWLAIAAHFMIPGERLTPRRTLGLALALTGVVAAMAGNARPASDNAFLGDLMCLLGSMFWAAIALLARLSRLSRAAPEMQLTYQLTVSAVVLIAMAPFFGDLLRDLTPVIAGIFAFQVVAIGVVGFLTWFWILKIYPASDMASFGFLAPVFGVIFGWLILGEEVGLRILLALALVSAGIVLINYRRRRDIRST